MIITFCNPKGGTGKTASVLHTARALVQTCGIETTVIDLDASTQSLTRRCGVIAKEPVTIGGVLGGAHVAQCSLRQAVRPIADPVGIHIAPATINLANVALGLKQRQIGALRALQQAITRDAHQRPILIDCPGDADVLTLNALVAADLVIIPTEPQTDSIAGVRTVMDLVAQLADEFGYAPVIAGTIACRVENTIAHTDGLQALRAGGMPNILAEIPKRGGQDATEALDDAYAVVADFLREEIIAC